MNTESVNTAASIDAIEIMERCGDTFEVTSIDDRTSVPGKWVSGTICGCKFQCLVFAEHAEITEHELDGSRIGKLWIKRPKGYVVAHFDRGWVMEPIDFEADEIVAFLAAGLADHVYC